ncbi:SDR family oxidoreductase [Acrocarpospora macrocephala]|uniref:NADH-flavin reductase n=1 Tax=Acrocarpospora macrocephala TaxID=150177 RepID=A0A5M3WMS9_9ACTN|nr:NAD(P)H-binding protein [Acrocarpospora macrocephala]GES09800.1 NADH-flavin reductase [Acrocarpospora macrocephala]
MRIVIFGASGGTGRLLVEQALHRGHKVTAVARSLDRLEPHDRLTLQPADVRDEHALHAIAADHDAAISVISRPVRAHGDLHSRGTHAIVNALQAQGVPRFICVSSGGVHPKDPGLPLWYRLAIPLFFKDLYRDMYAMEQIVRASTLDWTLVRASYLVDTPARGHYRIEDGHNPRGGSRLARADLAAFLLDELDNNRWLKATPTLAY